MDENTSPNGIPSCASTIAKAATQQTNLDAVIRCCNFACTGLSLRLLDQLGQGPGGISTEFCGGERPGPLLVGCWMNIVKIDTNDQVE